MDCQIPTPAEIRDDRLEYAFNSLMSVPQIVKFAKAKSAVNWLVNLNQSGTAVEIIGLLIEQKYTYVLADLKRSVECCGIEAKQHCQIWVRVTNQQSCSISFLSSLYSSTYSKKPSSAPQE